MSFQDHRATAHLLPLLKNRRSTRPIAPALRAMFAICMMQSEWQACRIREVMCVRADSLRLELNREDGRRPRPWSLSMSKPVDLG